MWMSWAQRSSSVLTPSSSPTILGPCCAPTGSTTRRRTRGKITGARHRDAPDEAAEVGVPAVSAKEQPAQTAPRVSEQASAPRRTGALEERSDRDTNHAAPLPDLLS